MVEIFQTSAHSECIGLHNARQDCEDPKSQLYRADFRESFRIQITPLELDFLRQQYAIMAGALRLSDEKKVGNYWVAGADGELGDEKMDFDFSKFRLSGKLCEELAQKRYCEASTPLVDVSILVRE